MTGNCAALQALADLPGLASQWRAKIINRLTIGIIIAGLFIGSSMLSLSSMEPRLLGVPVLAFFGYLGAAVLSVWVVFDISKRKL